MEGVTRASCVEVEFELPVVRKCFPQSLHRQPGGLAHTMGVDPALHPDVATLQFPDFGELHDTPTVGTFEGIVTRAGFDALTPIEMLEGLNYRFEVEQRGLKADRFQGNAGDVCELAFDVAGVEIGVAHNLHTLSADRQAFRGDVRDQTGDEVEGRAGDGDALFGIGVDVPVGDLLTIVADDV